MIVFSAHFEKLLTDKKVSDDIKSEVRALLPKVSSTKCNFGV